MWYMTADIPRNSVEQNLEHMRLALFLSEVKTNPLNCSQ